MSQAFSASVTGGKQFDDVLEVAGAADLRSRGAARLQAAGEIAGRRHREPVVGIDRGRRRRGDKGRGSGVRRDQTVRGRRRDRHADLFSACAWRRRPCRRSRTRSDHAAHARPRRPARRRAAAAATPSMCRSRRRTSTASAARRATSPARSRARWRAGSGVCERTSCPGRSAARSTSRSGALQSRAVTQRWRSVRSRFCEAA